MSTPSDTPTEDLLTMDQYIALEEKYNEGEDLTDDELRRMDLYMKNLRRQQAEALAGMPSGQASIFADMLSRL